MGTKLMEIRTAGTVGGRCNDETRPRRVLTRLNQEWGHSAARGRALPGSASRSLLPPEVSSSSLGPLWPARALSRWSSWSLPPHGASPAARGVRDRAWAVLARDGRSTARRAVRTRLAVAAGRFPGQRLGPFPGQRWAVRVAEAMDLGAKPAPGRSRLAAARRAVVRDAGPGTPARFSAWLEGVRGHLRPGAGPGAGGEGAAGRGRAAAEGGSCAVAGGGCSSGAAEGPGNPTPRVRDPPVLPWNPALVLLKHYPQAEGKM